MNVVMMYIALFLVQVRGYEGQLDPASIYCMAHAVYHESRGEPLAGQAFVAQVIINRVNHKSHPDNPCDVVYEPWQFSHIKKTKPDYDSAAWKLAVGVSTQVYAGLIVDQTKGSTMYYAYKKVKPKWDFNKLAYVGKIGGHKFFYEIN